MNKILNQVEIDPDALKKIVISLLEKDSKGIPIKNYRRVLLMIRVIVGAIAEAKPIKMKAA